MRIESIDLLTLGFSCRYVETLGEVLVAVDELGDDAELEFVATEATTDVTEAEAPAAAAEGPAPENADA